MWLKSLSGVLFDVQYVLNQDSPGHQGVKQIVIANKMLG